MRYLFIGIFAIISNSLFSQWNKVAKPYQDKMDYFSAAQAYSEVLDTGKVEDFVQYTRVLFNQGEYKKTYENYALLVNKKLLYDHYDFQAFYTCMSILDLPCAKTFDTDYKTDLIFEPAVFKMISVALENHIVKLVSNAARLTTFAGREFLECKEIQFARRTMR